MRSPDDPDRPLNVLSVSSMFPSSGLPRFGVFVRHRLRCVAARADLRVVSGVPAFPLAARLLGRYQPRRAIPRRELHAGPPGDGAPPLEARYPRFLSVPAVLKPLDGPSLALAVLWELARLRREGFAPDVIDAHLAYPDGFAAVLVGALTGLPVTITVRGHDLNFMSQFPVRWAMTRFALRHADRVMGVCQALVDAAVAAGADREAAVAVINGVDTALFRPIPREEARAALGLPADRKIVVSVGHPTERKGFHVLIDALSRMAAPRPLLAIVGGAGQEGDYRAELEARVRRLALDDDVRFAGAVANDELRPWYAAADVSALASSREGWANVLFESMACGVPVVATNVWGTPECISRPEYGILVGARTAEAFAEALRDALYERAWDAGALVAYAARNTWDRVGERHLAELRAAVRSAQGQARPFSIWKRTR